MVTLLDDGRLFLVTPYGNSETLLGDGKDWYSGKVPQMRNDTALKRTV